MTKREVRRARRSGEYPCDICGKRRPLTEHHIHGREVRNWRSGWNLAAICPDCHEDVHIGVLIILGWYQTDTGRCLVWHKKGEPLPPFGEAATPPLWGEEPKLGEGATPYIF